MTNTHLSRAASILLLTAASSYATISFDLEADLIMDQNGVALPTNTLILLVASTSNLTFDLIAPGTSTAFGTRLGVSSDDYIIYSAGLNSAGNLIKNAGPLTLANIPGWTPGDPVQLLWFNGLTSGSVVVPGGTRYGSYTNPLSVDFSGPWVTPNDGVTAAPIYFFNQAGGTLGAGASNPAITGRSSLVVTPEPTSALLVSLGLVTLAARRRRVA